MLPGTFDMQYVTFTLRPHLTVILDMSSIASILYGRAEGAAMRKWYFPMTVVGLGGLGWLLFTKRGRRAVGMLAEYLPQAPQRFAEWNEAAQRELDRIQTALDHVAENLRDEGFDRHSAFSH